MEIFIFIYFTFRIQQMKPHINATDFGSITIENLKYNHDVYIQLDGSVRKRKKKLSKAVYGTSHIISVEEARHIFDKDAELLIVGSGQYAQVTISEEAAEFFKRKKCHVKCAATPDAIKKWNQSEIKNKIGLFHVTC
jgi:hypothetical protein